MTRLLSLVTIALNIWAIAPGRAEEAAGSVLVSTVPAQRGSLPELVSAFGSAGPALDGGLSIALQQEGRVVAIGVTPGEAVRAGDRLLVFAPSSAARVTYQQAASSLALAQGQRTRTAKLLEQQLATRDQLAQADKALSDAQAALDAFKREGLGLPQITVTAPFDGIVTTIPVSQGDRIQPGAALLTLTRMDGLVVTAGVEESDRDRIRPGQDVVLNPVTGGAAIAGHVLRIDGILNPKTRLVDVDVSVPRGSVLSNSAFEAGIAVGVRQGWIVPHGAVQLDEQGGVLFQVHGGHAVRVAVQVLGTDGTSDVLQGKLAAGDRIVVEGAPQLDDGTAVREGSDPDKDGPVGKPSDE